jgi:hypothetical protein
MEYVEGEAPLSQYITISHLVNAYKKWGLRGAFSLWGV